MIFFSSGYFNLCINNKFLGPHFQPMFVSGKRSKYRESYCFALWMSQYCALRYCLDDEDYAALEESNTYHENPCHFEDINFHGIEMLGSYKNDYIQGLCIIIHFAFIDEKDNIELSFADLNTVTGCVRYAEPGSGIVY